jgi:hypothetical protein
MIETYEDLEKLFDRISFEMPGITVSAATAGPLNVLPGFIKINYRTVSARHGEAGQRPAVNVGLATIIGPNYTEDAVVKTLRTALVGLLTHEVDEWLRLDGELVSDPHV